RMHRAALLEFHDWGKAQFVLMELSSASGFLTRGGAPEAAAKILVGVGHARRELGIQGTSSERDAELRIAKRIEHELGPGSLERISAPDLQRMIDIALDALDEISRTA